MANVDQTAQDRQEMYELGLEVLITERHLRIIARRIAGNRILVAGNLGFAADEIDIIEADYDGVGQGGIREKAFQMLIKWKRRNGDLATKLILGNALRESGFEEIAKALEIHIR